MPDRIIVAPDSQLLCDVVLQVGGIRSLAVNVRSVPLYGLAAGSSELVICNFPAAGITVADQLASAGW